MVRTNPVIAAALTLGLAFGAAACSESNQDGALEEAGEAIEEAGEEAGEAVGEGMEAAGEAIDDAGEEIQDEMQEAVTEDTTHM